MHRSRHRRLILFVLLAAFAGTSTACARYKFTDTETGNVYYAKSARMKKRIGGSVTFTDAVTGDRVTLDSFERERIGRQEFGYEVQRARSGDDDRD